MKEQDRVPRPRSKRLRVLPGTVEALSARWSAASARMSSASGRTRSICTCNGWMPNGLRSNGCYGASC